MAQRQLALATIAAWWVLGACQKPSGIPTMTTTQNGSTVDASAPAALRAFYSGHSLSDGIPEVIAGLAAARGKSWSHVVRSAPGSLLRERAAWPDEQTFDALVATERHDLPYAAYHEQTVKHLSQLHARHVKQNPAGRTWFYHVWMSGARTSPQAFVDYERRALPLWECVASQVNRMNAAQGTPGRVLVLPGATALADLVQDLMADRVLGIVGATPDERIGAVFRDDVHLTPIGTYFLAAIHYSTLFGESAEGIAPPPEIALPLAHELQRRAWQHVLAYAPQAEAAASRDMSACRAYAADVMCEAFHNLPSVAGQGVLSALKNTKNKVLCRMRYNADDPKNPFR